MPIIRFEGSNDLTVETNNKLSDVIRVFAGILFSEGYSLDKILEAMNGFIASEEIKPQPEIKKLEC